MTQNTLNIVLYQPVIPQNTGSIARLCACTGATLHLIHPLGFQVDESAVKRAGLDYWPYVDVRNHDNWAAFLNTERPENISFFSKFSNKNFFQNEYALPQYLVFGSETTGLPDDIKQNYPNQLFKIPMRTSIVRSLNLAQSAAVVVYEVIRQNQLSESLN